MLPRENPRIAVAVIVENAGFGATWAGPIASMIMEKYLNDTLTTERMKDFERIAAHEIILPVVKQKRMRLDSIRRVRIALEMGDSSVLHNALPAAPDAPKFDINIEKKRIAPPKPLKDSVPVPGKPDSVRAVAALLRKDREWMLNPYGWITVNKEYLF